jgi:hypothetical protein
MQHTRTVPLHVGLQVGPSLPSINFIPAFCRLNQGQGPTYHRISKIFLLLLPAAPLVLLWTRLRLLVLVPVPVLPPVPPGANASGRPTAEQVPAGRVCLVPRPEPAQPPLLEACQRQGRLEGEQDAEQGLPAGFER